MPNVDTIHSDCLCTESEPGLHSHLHMPGLKCFHAGAAWCMHAMPGEGMHILLTCAHSDQLVVSTNLRSCQDMDRACHRHGHCIQVLVFNSVNASMHAIEGSSLHLKVRIRWIASLTSPPGPAPGLAGPISERVVKPVAPRPRPGT